MLNIRSLPRRRTRTGRTNYGAVAGLTIGSVLLGGGMFLAGCSASSSSSSSSTAAGSAALPPSAASGQKQVAPVPEASASANASGPSGSGPGTTARLIPGNEIIYTAQLTVRADSVSSATARAAQIAQGVGGYVSSETASANPDHPSEAT